MLLLNPEWQGYGESAEVYHGAMALADVLFRGREVVTVGAPARESLEPVDGVLGLASIAARFARTLAILRGAAPDRMLTVGGTCGTELAPIAYLNERHAGEMAVIWIDAHGDLNTPASSPSGHFHGMVLRTLLGDGPAALTRELRLPLTPAQVFLVGVRDLDPPEAEFVGSAPIARAGADVFREPHLLGRRLREAGFSRVYVHFDVDVIDPASLPVALLPVPGGPTSDQVSALVAALLSDFDVAGLSVLEYCDRGPELAARFHALLRAAGVASFSVVAAGL